MEINLTFDIHKCLFYLTVVLRALCSRSYASTHLYYLYTSHSLIIISIILILYFPFCIFRIPQSFWSTKTGNIFRLLRRCQSTRVTTDWMCLYLMNNFKCVVIINTTVIKSIPLTYCKCSFFWYYNNMIFIAQMLPQCGDNFFNLAKVSGDNFWKPRGNPARFTGILHSPENL